MKLLALPGIHYLAARFCGPLLRRLAFDAKFENGDWIHSPDYHLAKVISELYAGGDILSMGNGGNALGRALDQKDYYFYLGLDVSTKATAYARQLSDCNKQHFITRDMTKFKSSWKFDVIVFPESIYYLPPTAQLSLLRKLSSNLKKNGHFIITIAQPARQFSSLELIRNNFTCVSDRAMLSWASRWLLVFKP